MTYTIPFRNTPEWHDITCHDDLRTAEATQAVLVGADRLRKATHNSLKHLLWLELYLGKHSSEFLPILHLITKAAISKQRVSALKKPVHLDLVVPMYHEAIRISPRLNSKSSLLVNSLKPDVNGEDALLRKYIELKWLAENSLFSFGLIFVDDICDQKSGEYALGLIKENKLPNCQVLFLEKAIKSKRLSKLRRQALEAVIADQKSIRGGALCLGFEQAVTQAKKLNRVEQTFIGYLDTDSSYSATQVGIPMWELISDSSVMAATASRQHPLTYMELPKDASQTSSRSPGLIRVKQIAGYLRKYVLGSRVPADTQSGFKLFRPHVLEETLKQPNKAYNFSYDTQLLSRIDRLYGPLSVIKTFGVVCLDCDELSTANNGMTYFYALNILLTIADEIGLNRQGDECWLLDFLAKNPDNYKLAIKLLENKPDAAALYELNQTGLALIASVRTKIKTDKDTTAVGDYFTPVIFQEVVRAFQYIAQLQRKSSPLAIFAQEAN